MGWFFKSTPAKKIADAIKTVSKIRADFNELQEGLARPSELTLKVAARVPKIIARFERNVSDLRNNVNNLADVVDPENYTSISEQLTALENRSSEMAQSLRDPSGRNPDFTPFRITLQVIEHLLNVEKKRLSS